MFRWGIAKGLGNEKRTKKSLFNVGIFWTRLDTTFRLGDLCLGNSNQVVQKNLFARYSNKKKRSPSSHEKCLFLYSNRRFVLIYSQYKPIFYKANIPIRKYKI